MLFQLLDYKKKRVQTIVNYYKLKFIVVQLFDQIYCSTLKKIVLNWMTYGDFQLYQETDQYGFLKNRLVNILFSYKF